MKVVEIRSLLFNKPKKIKAENNIQLCFSEFIELMKKHNLPITLEDTFYAGYVCSNPIFREQFLKNKKAEIKIDNITNNRIQNIVWK